MLCYVMHIIRKFELANLMHIWVQQGQCESEHVLVGSSNIKSPLPHISFQWTELFELAFHTVIGNMQRWESKQGFNFSLNFIYLSIYL